MPFTIRVEPDHQLAILTFTGRLDGRVMQEALQACYDDPGWTPGTNMLWDYRRIREVVLEPGDMQRIIDAGFARQERGGAGLDVNLVDCDRDLHVLVSKSFVAYRNYRRGALRSPAMCCRQEEAAQMLGVPLAVLQRADAA